MYDMHNLEAKAAGFRSRYGRGLGTIALAVLGAFIVGQLPSWGVDAYTSTWCGAAFKTMSGAFIGYRASKDLCRIDPSMVPDDQRGLMHLARAAIILGGMIAVALSP